MSKTTEALEALVAEVIANSPVDGEENGARKRFNRDRAFGSILKLIAPRFRHFIRQYGLIAHWEDAEQVCAIAVHRAIEAYDPSKAQFTTFVNWQIRGELQSLRFRVMTDQRSSARKVEATTVSLHSLASGLGDDDGPMEVLIEDEDALERVESGASDYLAQNATAALVEEYMQHLRTLGIEQIKKRPRSRRPVPVRDPGSGQPPRPRFREIDPEELARLDLKLARDREILRRRVFDIAPLDDLSGDTSLTKERIRQITKRATRDICELTARNPRFTVMADYRSPGDVAAAIPSKSAA